MISVGFIKLTSEIIVQTSGKLCFLKPEIVCPDVCVCKLYMQNSKEGRRFILVYVPVHE